jgi:DNA-binding transcriptional LysR family regulator
MNVKSVSLPMNLHRLDLVSLALFVRVLRTGSISKGAERAHLALAAASRRIADLEEAVGSPLLERHSRGVRATAAGEALLAHAQRILGEVDRLAADLSDHARGVVGVVRLWANTSAVTQFLPGDLAAFSAQHPRVRIELHERDSSEVVMAVLDGRAEIGIFAERVDPLGLQTRVYRRDRLVLVVPKGHPLARRRRVSLDEVVGHDFVSLSQGTSLAQRLAAEAGALGAALRVRVHVRSFDAMCQMVAARLGIAVLPLDAVQPHIRSMGLVRVDLAGDWIHRELLIGIRNADRLSKSGRLMLAHLEEAALA